MTQEVLVKAENLTKKFGEVAAVDDLTLTIPAGSFFEATKIINFLTYNKKN